MGRRPKSTIRNMKILFYTPFKPLGHAHPSGDLITATGIYEYLQSQGHQVIPVSSLRCRWIYWRPWLWPKLLWERKRIIREFSDTDIDLWFTYHSYYKAPDLLGPIASRKLKIPYVIFQGIYSTKRRRKFKTRIGFYLNKDSLCAADHIFSNKQVDLLNLKRLLPESEMTYVSPGLRPQDFWFDAYARTDLRTQWNKTIIVNWLMENKEMDFHMARAIASSVEEKVLNIGILRIRKSLIKHLVLSDIDVMLQAQEQLVNI